jgi:RNA polymerase sigma-70 factor (ECF subfamily)
MPNCFRLIGFLHLRYYASDHALSVDLKASQAGPMHDQDFEDLCLVQRGNHKALASLYERYSRVVYSVAMRILRNPAGAEDLVQEVFLQIWRSPEKFMAGSADLTRWLAVTAKHRSIDVLRKKKSLIDIVGLDIASSQDVEYQSHQRLMCERAGILLESLPATQRYAIKLAFFSDKSHSEIALETGCALGTIKTRIRSALTTLRKGLERETLPAEVPCGRATYPTEPSVVST